MRKNKLLLIIVAVVAVVAAIFVVTTRKKSGTIGDLDKNFAVSDTASVSKIFLANKDGFSTLLERNSDGSGWTVNGQWEASIPMIDLLLTTICRIRPTAPLPKAAIENIIKRLAYNATKVEIYGTGYRVNFWGIKLFPHETMLRCYYVGDVTPDNLGTYMLMDGSKIPFVVIFPGLRGYVASRYEVAQDAWRTHRLFNVGANEIESVHVENIIDPDASFTVNTNAPNGKFAVTTLAGESIPQPLDSLKVFNYLNSFKRINFESFTFDYLNPHDVDSILNTTPIYKLTLIQKGGKTYNMTFYPLLYRDIVEIETGDPMLDLDRCYAYLDSGEMVVVQYFTFDKILRQRAYFLQR